MRVAIIANVPLWTLPGLEHLKHNRHYATWLEPLVPAFESTTREFDLHWITMCKETPRPIEHRVHGQTFHIIPRGRLSVSMLTGYAGEILRIRQVIRRIQPDLVHAWGSEDVCALAGAFSGVSNRLFTLQGCFTEYLRLLGGGFLFRVQTMYEKPAVRRYRAGTAETPGAGELLSRLNPEMRVHLIDYGVNQEFFNAAWDPSPQPQLAFVGSVTERKGIRALIKVAGSTELSHISFKIMGDGPLRAELELSSPPNVEWLGGSTRDDVIRHLCASWALVMPTHSDTGPTVVKEARVIGLPVITTQAAGASSYILDGNCGHVIPTGDLDALKQSILAICRSRDHCLTCGRQTWEEHRKALHPITTATKFACLYREMLRISV